MNFHHIAFTQKEHAVIVAFVFLNLQCARFTAATNQFRAQRLEVRGVDIQCLGSRRIMIRFRDEPNLNIVPLDECRVFVLTNQFEPEVIDIEIGGWTDDFDRDSVCVYVPNGGNLVKLFHRCPSFTPGGARCRGNIVAENSFSFDNGGDGHDTAPINDDLTRRLAIKTNLSGA